MERDGEGPLTNKEMLTLFQPTPKRIVLKYLQIEVFFFFWQRQIEVIHAKSSVYLVTLTNLMLDQYIGLGRHFLDDAIQCSSILVQLEGILPFLTMAVVFIFGTIGVFSFPNNLLGLYSQSTLQYILVNLYLLSFFLEHVCPLSWKFSF